MNIEFIEFYPIEYRDDKGILTGTLRIRLSDIGIHILGIYVSKRKGSWYFSLPGNKSIHHKTGEAVRFPFIVFEDKEKQGNLMNAIHEKGRAFIEMRLADNENPLIFPQKPKSDSSIPAPTLVGDSAKKTNECVSMEKAKKLIIWTDPPKRKVISRRK